MPLPITEEQRLALAELRAISPKLAALADDIAQAIDPRALVDVGDPMYTRDFLTNLCLQWAKDSDLIAQLLPVWLSRAVGTGVLGNAQAAAFASRAEVLADGRA